MTHKLFRTVALSFLVLPLLVMTGCSENCGPRCRFLKSHDCVRGHEVSTWAGVDFVCDEYAPKNNKLHCEYWSPQEACGVSKVRCYTQESTIAQ
jgi:hypothetical protein